VLLSVIINYLAITAIAVTFVNYWNNMTSNVINSIQQMTSDQWPYAFQPFGVILSAAHNAVQSRQRLFIKVSTVKIGVHTHKHTLLLVASSRPCAFHVLVYKTMGARGSIVVKALCYKLENRGFDTQ
jgi:hypothetical protein